MLLRIASFIVLLLLSATSLAMNVNQLLIPELGPVHGSAGTIQYQNNTGTQRNMAPITVFIMQVYVDAGDCNSLQIATTSATGTINIPSDNLVHSYRISSTFVGRHSDPVLPRLCVCLVPSNAGGGGDDCFSITCTGSTAATSDCTGNDTVLRTIT